MSQAQGICANSTRIGATFAEGYEQQQGLLDLYSLLAEAEVEIANGDEGKDFFEVARKLRKKVHGKI